jgi:ankyrin repeat protein
LISNGYVNLNGEPFSSASHCSDVAVIKIMTMLLDAGANINVSRPSRRLACHVAILENQFDALKLLVERGANLGVVDSNGRSLLSTVSRCDRSERFVILLLDAGAPLDRLSNGDLMLLVNGVAAFNRLVARGVNFTAMRNERGATLCHRVACIVAREDDLRFLVNVCGNDIHAVDNTGWTPLHWAASSRNELAMRVLVELGAEIDRQGQRWGRALINVCFRWRTKSSIVELLLALGADVNLVTNDGRTACHRRCTKRVLCCVLLSRQEAILISRTKRVKLLE